MQVGSRFKDGLLDPVAVGGLATYWPQETWKISDTGREGSKELSGGHTTLRRLLGHLL